MRKLLLSFVFACVCIAAQASYSFKVVNSDGTSSYYTFVSKEDKTVAFCQPLYSGYVTPYKGEVVIPSSVIYEDIEYTVTSIADDTFYSGEEITSVKIPNTITSIGDDAFRGCTRLTSINIPNSVTSIGDHAFGGLSGLTSITFMGWASISSYAFENCKNIKKITMMSKRPINIEYFPDVYSTATLYVPLSAYNAYCSCLPWMKFKKIETFDDYEGESSNKCSAPEITFSDKTLSFSCATPLSQIHYSYYLGNMGSTESGGELVTLTNKSNSIIVMAYATAEGYEQSAAVIKSFPFDATVNDINGDNKITIADVTTLIDVIVNQ